MQAGMDYPLNALAINPFLVSYPYSRYSLLRSWCLIRVGAILVYDALVAEGFSGDADLSPVVLKEVAEFCPLIFGNDCREFRLNLIWVLRDCQPYTLGQPAYVGVHPYGRHTECVAENNIGCLPAHTVEAQQVFQFVGYLALILFRYVFCADLYAFCLVSEKSC